jgi:ribosomal protein S18 acetylase RimI-like enzyme
MDMKLFSMTYATTEDKPHFCNEWEDMPESEYNSKVRDKRCYVLRYEDKPIGYMRYNLIFDFIPFITCFVIDNSCQKKGFGTETMSRWEDEMRSLGYKMVMISTEVGEDAQHFYRKLGYKDMGSIVLGGILPYEQNTLEMFMGKAL